MIHPAVLAQIGWSSDEVNDEEMVTVIRRQVRYDEVIMTRKEFEQMNKQLCDGGYEQDFDRETKEELDSRMKDIEYTEPVEYYYTAIVGDVRSCTDDVIFTAPFEWIDADDLYDEGIQLCEMNAVDCMMRK